MKKHVVSFALTALLIACSNSKDSSTESPHPASIAVIGGGTQTGIVGLPVSVTPTIAVRDQNGGILAGIAIAVHVTSGAGSIANAPTTTIAGAGTPIGTWTLGTAPGVNAVTVTAGELTTTISITANAGAPAALVAKGGTTGLAGTVGVALTTNISFQVFDQYTNAVSGVTPQITASNGGSVSAGATDANGMFAITTWTFGTLAGAQSLTVNVGTGVQAVVVNGTAQAGPPSQLATALALPLTGLAGTTLTTPLSVMTTDRFGNIVPGVNVTFTVQSGGGAIIGATTATSSASGVATAGQWTLGRGFAPQAVLATAGTASLPITGQVTSAYQMSVRFLGTVTPLVQTHILGIVDRIRAAVVGHVGDIPVTNLDINDACGIQGVPPLTETIHDIIFYVNVTPLDGALGELAEAGPCLVRTDNELAVVSEINIDSTDVQFMITNNIFDSVVMHEMLHGLDFGITWPDVGLLDITSLTDPRFLGLGATAAFQTAGGTSMPGVPVENMGGAGSIFSHWRTTTFGDELMTAFISAGQLRPFSAITIQSLGDLGYTVNPFAADAFHFTGPAVRLGVPGDGRTWSFDNGLEVVRKPRGRIDRMGGVTRLP